VVYQRDKYTIIHRVISRERELLCSCAWLQLWICFSCSEMRKYVIIR